MQCYLLLPALIQAGETVSCVWVLNQCPELSAEVTIGAQIQLLAWIGHRLMLRWVRQQRMLLRSGTLAEISKNSLHSTLT